MKISSAPLTHCRGLFMCHRKPPSSSHTNCGHQGLCFNSIGVLVGSSRPVSTPIGSYRKHTSDLLAPGLLSSVDFHVLPGQGLSSLPQCCPYSDSLCTICPSLSPATRGGFGFQASQMARTSCALVSAPHAPGLTHPPQPSPLPWLRLQTAQVTPPWCLPLPGISPLPAPCPLD